MTKRAHAEGAAGITLAAVVLSFGEYSPHRSNLRGNRWHLRAKGAGAMVDDSGGCSRDRDWRAHVSVSRHHGADPALVHRSMVDRNGRLRDRGGHPSAPRDRGRVTAGPRRCDLDYLRHPPGDSTRPGALSLTWTGNTGPTFSTPYQVQRRNDV